MAFQAIPKIQINGSPSAFGNAFPFDMRYTVGFGDKPSTLVLNMVSEAGTYIAPKLTDVGYKGTYTIEIGNNIRLDYHLVNYNIKKGPQGNTLEVTFVDQSKILDRYLVGLHKRAGDAGANGYALSGTMLIVGRELHPCDANRDGIVDQEDIELSIVDPCDPCPDCPPFHNLTKCDDVSCVNILDVAYNFNHLKSAMELLGISMDSVPVTNDFYLQEYEGTLREVLLSWVNYYCFTFYWTEDNKLKFLDVTSPIIINEQIPTHIIHQKQNI